MNLGLEGRRAVLVASSRGLGFGIAEALVAEGVDVLISGRDRDRLVSACRELDALKAGKATFVQADVGVSGDVDRILEAADRHLGAVDILLNNSGGPPMGRALDVGTDLWRQYFEAMVLAPIRLTQALVPRMASRGWGRILSISASTVAQPMPALVLSNTLRAALTNWMKTLAGEVAADGVTVNMIVPGRILTARVDELDSQAALREGATAEAVRRSAVSSIPAGRDGTIAEFAAAAVFLARDTARYITGGAIRVDGGMIRTPIS